jgi:hypothetical protein
MQKTAEKRYCRVPEKVGETVKTIMADTDIRRMEFEWHLFSKWSEIAGEAIAEASTPVDIHESVLYLRVDNSVWRNELYYMKQDIINKLNIEAGRKVINNIIFR